MDRSAEVVGDIVVGAAVPAETGYKNMSVDRKRRIREQVHAVRVTDSAADDDRRCGEREREGVVGILRREADASIAAFVKEKVAFALLRQGSSNADGEFDGLRENRRAIVNVNDVIAGIGG